VHVQLLDQPRQQASTVVPRRVN